MSEYETVGLKPSAEPARFRARDLGLETGIYLPGDHNAITDVPGVLVGQKTVWKDPPEVRDVSHRVRSGVTAVLPHSGDMLRRKVPCGIYLGNAFGKLTGYTQVKELGSIETPILLTSTLNVPKVADALITYVLQLAGNEEVRSVNPIVGETNDGDLSDCRSRPVQAQDVVDALTGARGGPVLEGSVGAGTGTCCLGWKGGIGTASRILPPKGAGYTVGVLVQTNFGGLLTVNGAAVGRELGTFPYRGNVAQQDGSCMVIAATDAPLCSRNLERLAKRAMHGLVKCGSSGSTGSGDYAIAFSTAYTVPYDGPVEFLNEAAVSALFLAAQEASEEAVLNSMLKATTVVGRDEHCSRAIPLEHVIGICDRHDVLFAHSKLPPWAPTSREGSLEDCGRRLEALVEHVSCAQIPDGTKSSLLGTLNGARKQSSEALMFIREAKEEQANNALRTCSKMIETARSQVMRDDGIPEPYASLFVSHANLGTWVCEKAGATRSSR